MPYIFPDSAINKDYFTDNHASGGEGGSRFDFIKLDKGAILKRIKIWKRDWRIGAVEVWMSDGSNHVAGQRSGWSSEFKFKKGELIEKLNVQASDAQSSRLSRRRLGAIWFKTNKGRDWGVFSNDLPASGRYWPDVGSGVCCGVFGAEGDAVDRFGFAMLRPVKKATLIDVKYPKLDMEIVASRPDVVAHQIFKNGTAKEQSFTLSGSKAVTIKREWSVTAALSMTWSTQVTAGIPEVASTTTGFSWTVSMSATHTLSSTNTETRTWSWPLVCPPHRRIMGDATMYSDDIDIDYEAKMELQLENGKKYQYEVKGVYSGMNARTGAVSVKDLGHYGEEEEEEEKE